MKKINSIFSITILVMITLFYFGMEKVCAGSGMSRAEPRPEGENEYIQIDDSELKTYLLNNYDKNADNKLSKYELNYITIDFDLYPNVNWDELHKMLDENNYANGITFDNYKLEYGQIKLSNAKNIIHIYIGTEDEITSNNQVFEDSFVISSRNNYNHYYYAHSIVDKTKKVGEYFYFDDGYKYYDYAKESGKKTFTINDLWNNEHTYSITFVDAEYDNNPKLYNSTNKFYFSQYEPRTDWIQMYSSLYINGGKHAFKINWDRNITLTEEDDILIAGGTSPEIYNGGDSNNPEETFWIDSKNILHVGKAEIKDVVDVALNDLYYSQWWCAGCNFATSLVYLTKNGEVYSIKYSYPNSNNKILSEKTSEEIENDTVKLYDGAKRLIKDMPLGLATANGGFYVEHYACYVEFADGTIKDASGNVITHEIPDYTGTVESDYSDGRPWSFKNNNLSFEKKLMLTNVVSYRFDPYSKNNDYCLAIRTDGSIWEVYSTGENKLIYVPEEYTYKFDNADKIEVFLKNIKEKGLIIRIDAPFDKFKSLKIGNVEFERDVDYNVTEGSTIITFTESGINKINKMDYGEYEIKASYEDNKIVTTKFEISKDIKNPKTGDGVIKYVIIGIVSIICLFFTLFYIKKKSN